MLSLKEMVKDNKKARFVYFRDNELFYKTEDDFLFSVPVSDVGKGTFNAEEKAILMMRYISKQMDSIKKEEELRKQNTLS